MMILRRLARLLAWLGAAAFLAAGAVAVAITVYLIPELPSTQSLKDVQFQVPLRVFSADRRLIAEFGEMRRKPLSASEIPPLMVDAILASEDQHFYQHPGVDWRGLARAVWHLVRTGKKGPGGSTITMQVARNFFLGREKTYLRKLNEILLALKIERELSKDEILGLYINKIFLGHRAYGVGAAAAVYYGRSVSELSLPQLAMIAGLPQRPSEYNPVTSPEQAKNRRDYVLRRMLAAGHIDEASFEAAVATPVTARLHNPIVELHAPYVAEMARAYMEERVGSGAAYTDGFQVITTIDSRLQTSATRAAREALMEYDVRHGYRGPELKLELPPGNDPARWETLLRDVPPVGGLAAALVLEVGEQDAKVHVRGHGETLIGWEGLRWARRYIDENRRGASPKQASDVLARGDVVRVVLEEDGWQLSQIPKVEGALVALRPQDGAIVALIGGFDFFRSKFNRATQAERQPGSSFKPFIYSAALEHGFTPASLINDAPIVLDDPSLEEAWRPENYSGKFFGPTRLRWALTKSRNLVSIRLLRAVGVDRALEHIARFGIDAGRLPRNLSLALGSGTITPLEIAGGYAVLANGGFRIEPYFVDKVYDARDNLVFEATPAVVCADCAAEPPADAPQARPVAMPDSGSTIGPARIAPRAVSAQNVWLMNSMLRDVVRFGTGRKALSLGRGDIAGKTGTTNDQRDAWFSGYVPSLVATAWVGFDQVAPLGRRETGGQAALPMWMKFMSEALVDVPEQSLEQPEGLITVRIDKVTGELTDASNPNAVFETFREQRAPGDRGRPGEGRGQDPRGATNGVGPIAGERAQGTTERLF